MDDIIEYSCANSDIQKILELDELRFEQLIEIIRDRIDPELKIIDYFSECKEHNLTHF